jgi:hypothetical protein
MECPLYELQVAKIAIMGGMGGKSCGKAREVVENEVAKASTDMSRQFSGGFCAYMVTERDDRESEVVCLTKEEYPVSCRLTLRSKSNIMSAEELNNTPAAAEEPMFAGLKKKSKKAKVNFDDLELNNQDAPNTAADAATASVADAEKKIDAGGDGSAPADAPAADDGVDMFADLKKKTKKKKKEIPLDLVRTSVRVSNCTSSYSIFLVNRRHQHPERPNRQQRRLPKPARWVTLET